MIKNEDKTGQYSCKYEEICVQIILKKRESFSSSSFNFSVCFVFILNLWLENIYV